MNFSKQNVFIVEDYFNKMLHLGMETSIDKFKNSGIKPFYLSFILFIWLMIVGYFLVKLFF